ncbi:MAG: hypothetical protein VB021_07525 [Oscillospiraceae bacterium]|nr:hypothetical protein [Oscillospiraceae bacterium]
MKQVGILLLLVVVCCALCACSLRATELSRRIILDSVAIDREGGQYVITAGWLRIKQDGSESGAFEGRGDTPGQALRSLEAAAQKPLFYSLAATVLIGGGAADDLDVILRFLVEQSDVRIGASLFYYGGDAGELLRAKTDARSFGEAAQALQEGLSNRKDISAPLYALADGAYGGGACGYLPVIAAAPADGTKADGDTVELRYAGLALCRGGRICALPGEDSADMLLLLCGKLHSFTVAVGSGEATITDVRVRVAACEDGARGEICVVCAGRAESGAAAGAGAIGEAVKNRLRAAYTICGAACIDDIAGLRARAAAGRASGFVERAPAEDGGGLLFRCEINTD